MEGRRAGGECVCCREGGRETRGRGGMGLGVLDSAFIFPTSLKHLICCLHNYCSPSSPFDRNNTLSGFSAVQFCARGQSVLQHLIGWKPQYLKLWLIANVEKKNVLWKKKHYLFLKLCSNYHLRQLFLVCALLLDVAACSKDRLPLLCSALSDPRL